MKKYTLLALSTLLCSTLFAARPVVRWDVVPYQRVSETFKVGVVAFHEKGVDVAFTVNGRKAWTAKRPSRNERTGVTEYVFPFDPAKYADGPVTIGATVKSEGEMPYELPALPLYANAGKTLGSSDVVWVDAVNGNEFAHGTKEEPYRSLKQGVQKAGDGGTVYLMAGEYDLKLVGGGLTREYWTLVTTAPGVKAGEVKVAGGRSGTEKLLCRNLDIFCDVDSGETGAVVYGEGGATMAWFDDCRISNAKGRTGGVVRPFGNDLRAFVTGGETSAMTFGPNAELVRKHVVKDVCGDALYGGLLAVNVTVSDINPEDSPVNDCSLYQGFAQPPKWVEDVILYNIRATDCNSRGLVGRQVKNAAFVNIGFSNCGDPSNATHFEAGLENVIFARIRLVNQPWEWLKTKSGREDLRPKDVRLFDVKAPKGFSGYDTTDGSAGLLVSDDAKWINR